MKFIISPSKEMSTNIKLKDKSLYKKAIYLKQANYINDILKNCEHEELSKIFKIKSNLLNKVVEYINSFNKEEYPAILSYDGKVFKELDRKNYNLEDFIYLNEKVFILSAMYGINTSFDLISKYRLDMTTNPFKAEKINLYDFWFFKINEYLERNVLNDMIINLASKEFSKLIDRKKFKVVDIEFYDVVDNQLKNIATYSKKARGNFLNFCVKNKIDNLENLKMYNEYSYKFSEKLSNDNKLVFIR